LKDKTTELREGEGKSGLRITEVLSVTSHIHLVLSRPRVSNWSTQTTSEWYLVCTELGITVFLPGRQKKCLGPQSCIMAKTA